jgi:osmotically inducible protein OsmC
MIEKTASARWTGGLRDGQGQITTQSGVLTNERYGFATRFEGGPGTNPEELVAASHASCFSMALSMVLGQSELTADSIETEAKVSLEEVADGYAVTRSHLTVKARIPDATPEQFREAAEAAKANCPISKLLTAEITMDATLEE